jgi:hypothetical protein
MLVSLIIKRVGGFKVQRLKSGNDTIFSIPNENAFFHPGTVNAEPLDLHYVNASPDTAPIGTSFGSVSSGDFVHAPAGTPAGSIHQDQGNFFEIVSHFYQSEPVNLL